MNDPSPGKEVEDEDEFTAEDDKVCVLRCCNSSSQEAKDFPQ